MEFTVNKYRVIRSHLGDKDYSIGDVRIANPTTVKHLVKKGVLVDITEEQESKEIKAVVKKAPVKKVKQDDRPTES